VLLKPSHKEAGAEIGQNLKNLGASIKINRKKLQSVNYNVTEFCPAHFKIHFIDRYI
jgi:hypothetical protein